MNPQQPTSGRATPFQLGERYVRGTLQTACALAVVGCLYGLAIAGPNGLLSPVEWVTISAILVICAAAIPLVRAVSIERLVTLAKVLSVVFCLYLTTNTFNAFFLRDDGDAALVYLTWYMPTYVFVYAMCDRDYARNLSIPTSSIVLAGVVVYVARQGDAGLGSMRTATLVISVLSHFVGILLLVGLSRFRERYAVERAKSAIAAERLAENERLLQQLSASEARFRSLVENSLDVVCVLDADGRFVDVGPRSADAWGQEPALLVGRRLIEIVTLDDRPTAQTFLQDVRSERTVVSREFSVMGRDGQSMPMLWLGRWLPEENAIYLSARDMTDRIENEMRLRQAQKLEALGQLTGGIAHDFNNLLTVVIGNADSIERSCQDQSMRPLAGLIRRAAERGADLTRRLLSFARRQPLQPAPVEVGALVNSTAGLLARTIGAPIRLSVKGTDSPCWSMVDSGGLEAAILNLAINARDAMPSGGEIVIEIGRADGLPDKDRFDVVPPAASYVTLRVRDNGEGIPPEIVERVIEPFFTTKPPGQGTGLGLSAVHGFVHQSQGGMTLTSKPGEGTEVTLYLPETTPSGEPKLKTADSGDSEVLPEGRGRILAVEDDPMLRESIADQIHGLGYTVDVVGDAREALLKLESDASYDLVFSDIVMPGGINGFDLAETMRDRWPGIPVLLTSGYSGDDRWTARERSPRFAILQKPYNQATLAGRLRDAIERRPD